MKSFWKVLGITAAVAALAPYRVEKDEENGKKKIQALLWSAAISPKEGDEKMSLDVSFGFNSPFAAAEEEEPLFEEEPVAEFTVESAADSDPEAAEDSAAEAEIEAIENGTESAPEASEEPEVYTQE